MSLVVRPTNEYARVLWQVWEGDEALLARWHVAAPCCLATAVNVSVALLLDESMAPDFTFYELRQGEELVGFFGVEPSTNFLITFGLRVGYRTPEIKAALWQCIRTFTRDNGPVCCNLYARNERAHRFLLAGGATPVDTIEFEGHAAITYLLN